MSRGFGRVQRRILHMLETHPEGFVLGDLRDDGTAASSLRRAAYKLEKDGLVALGVTESGFIELLVMRPSDPRSLNIRAAIGLDVRIHRSRSFGTTMSSSLIATFTGHRMTMEEYDDFLFL